MFEPPHFEMIQAFAKIIVQELKYEYNFDESDIQNEVWFEQPQKIKRLKFKLIDNFGRIVDLRGIEYSFTVDFIEVINSDL